MNYKNYMADLESSASGSQLAVWDAVFAIALAVMGLIVSEFLPASLLTPIAQDLGISEGLAGQAVSVTAGIAMVSSLFISVLTGRADRRKVFLFFGMLQIVSNFTVYYAHNFTVLLIGRILLGAGIGGFWAMLAVAAMRLVPEVKIAKHLP
ncbi:MFS transporter [Flavobacterium aquicola]|uniref:MFS transporter n=1 Tax=Flavobacterium aquicola TaxID=1682742 RepID=A0A3E0EMK2_9FLAO|nr:MFS transporter [Flavobacterium aquicola]REG99482.1 MFS transporter [Flavobacterium aquicola]